MGPRALLPLGGGGDGGGGGRGGEPSRDGALGDVLEVLVAAEPWQGVNEDAHSFRFWAQMLACARRAVGLS